MANDLVNIKEDASPTKKLASQSFARGVDTVHQEEVVIGDGTTNGRLLGITAANEAKVLSTVQPGVDIGDVTINNAAGAAAVNIQDGGNSLTVDGTVTTTPPANASTNVAQFGGTNVATGTGVGGVGIPRVTVSSDSSLAANQSVNLNQVGGAAVTEGQKTMAASLPVVVASDQDATAGVPVRASPLCVVVAPAANTGGTITLPAVAGQFHYITAIEVTRNATAALAGTATLAITTTNLPGGGTWFRVGNAMVAGGTQKDVAQQFTSPIKSSVVNTATTLVFPVPGAAVLWTATVWYYAAA